MVGAMRRPSVEVALAVILTVVVAAAAVVRIRGAPQPRAESVMTDDLFGASFSAGMCVGAAGGGTLQQRPADFPDTSTIDGVALAVEDIRELEFEDLPEPRYLPQEQMAAEVEEAFAEDYPDEDAEEDERELAHLGAIPPDMDLKATLSGFLGEQVSGFYDPETSDLVVLGNPGDLEPIEKVTLAHELDHALTDQVLGIPLDASPSPGEEDSALAARALVEGDASLTMSLFASRALPSGERFSLNLSAPEGGSLEELDRVPHYIVRTMLFPYLEGLLFVCGLQTEGGWAAVDAAYNDPPTTSAQILFPDRFEAGEEAADPRDPGSLPAPWARSDRSALGAADLLFLFEAPGGDRSKALRGPAGLAEGWAGGEMHLWRRGDDSALGVALAQRPEEPRLCDSVGSWYRAAFEGGFLAEPRPGEMLAIDGEIQDAVLRCPGNQIRLGIGPDLDTARALAR
jgi:hypothetical protein